MASSGDTSSISGIIICPTFCSKVILLISSSIKSGTSYDLHELTLDQSTSDNLVASTESELELKPQELTKKTEINKIYLFITKI